MANYSKTYRATATPSEGLNWYYPERMYDNDVDSYAYRQIKSTSATHINGFGIDLPSDAVVQSVEVHTKIYSSNSYGYICIYVLSDLETSDSTKRVYTTKVVNGASFSAKYVTQTYTGDGLAARLSEISLHGGNVIDFLKNLRMRFVIGSTSSSSSATCRIYDNYIVVNYKIPGYIITVNAGVGGTVTGGGEYDNGTTVTLTATPNTGYKFKQWSDGDTSATRTVTVTGNATYTAEFEKVTVTISASADPSEGGSVTGTGSYQYGETFTLTAVPNDGYKFVRWSTLNTTPSITRTAGLLDEDFTAYFEKEQTSNIFVGTQRVTAYCGTQKLSAYCGTKKLS